MCDELMKILDLLLRLIFRRKALEEADAALKKLKKKWLTDESHHLEDGLVDLGAATKNLLEKTQVSFERKRKFKGECKKIVLNLLLLICEKSSLNYCLVRNASSLSPINMVRDPEKSSICFRGLTVKLYAIKVITSNVADNAKNQYSDLLKIAKYEQNYAFVNLIYKNDRLDSYLSNFLTINDFKDIWHIYKIICLVTWTKRRRKRIFCE